MSLRKILFVGMHGAGKGTQAKLLERDYRLKQMSTGDMITQALLKNDSMVTPYRDHLRSGGYLPDGEIFFLVEYAIGNLDRERFDGFVLDGAVRNVHQAQKSLERNWFHETIFFKLDEEESERRVQERWERFQMSKNSPKAKVNRHRNYIEQTVPMLEYLRYKRVPIHEINAHPDPSLPQEDSIRLVHENVISVLGLK